MSLDSVEKHPANQDQLAEMEKILIEKLYDPELVRTYHDCAVATDQISRARKVFATLQERFPNNQQIRSLNIALCLNQKDNTAAMNEIETLMSVGMPEDELIDAGLMVRAKLGPMTIVNPSSADKTISLCMIVKDEIPNISACLKNAKLLVDEIIVVDTGSTDRTADAASVFGAQTFTYDWNDDFAAARNFSIEKAKGDWILILDADEMIASSDHIELREQICAHGDNKVAFSITTRNYTLLANVYQWQANDGSYPQHETGLGGSQAQRCGFFQE